VIRKDFVNLNALVGADMRCWESVRPPEQRARLRGARGKEGRKLQVFAEPDTGGKRTVRAGRAPATARLEHDRGIITYFRRRGHGNLSLPS
jgi:hypothetical protein